MKKCLNCGAEFQQRYNNEKFCSEECKRQFYILQNDNISNCLVCGKELTIKQLFHKRKACCQKCGHRLAIQNRDPEKVERWVNLMQEKQKESKTIRTKQSAKGKEREEQKLLEKLGEKKYDEYRSGSNKNDFIVETPRGFYFDIKKFAEYFNFSESAANRYKEAFNINLPNVKYISSGFSVLEQRVYEYLSENFKGFDFKWRQKENRRLFFNNKTKRWLECDILVYKNNTLFLGVEVNGKLFHDSDDVRYRDSVKIEQAKHIEGFKLFHVWSDNVEEDISNIISYLTSFDK